ncbi:MAG: cytochrome c biogenesis protein ResB [Phycisphaeraceae bacterium]|nr:MAG: cytochrome c biogenesis protein ResB [Phycisphaeraceae bacterium]
MRPHLDWHRTGVGRFLLFIGGLRLAIPVMALVALAMVWGTYLDSTQGAKVAARVVYGSGWFIFLMALICLSLIAAVVTRFPWNRKHVGFITVHTGLIILIVGSFWSLFGRLEGRIGLQEGQASAELEMTDLQLDLMQPGAGGPAVIASASAEGHVRGPLDLNGVKVEVVDRWENTAQEQWVADDAPNPLRAFEIAFGSGATDSMWIGQASMSGGPAFAGGMTVRVLGQGETWTPPAPSEAPASDYVFIVGGTSYPLGAAGDQAFPGWTIKEVDRYKSALVAAGGLSENPSGGDNPAIDVQITDGAGTTERHTAFEKFPDMVIKKTIEGSAASGAELRAGGSGSEELVLYGDPGALKAAYVPASGPAQTFEHTGGLPWVIEAGGRMIRVLDQRTHARQSSRFVQAPPAGSDSRPALVVKINGGEPQPLAWKSSVTVPSTASWVRFGPRRVVLPFTLRLEDFRKKDYPGTAMAMAYESDVLVNSPKQEGERTTISMNNPYKFGAWKVYQSGFVGDQVSIFSVMRDPGLPVIYFGSIVLCVGILVTFYARAFSRGHPGIARPQRFNGEPS